MLALLALVPRIASIDRRIKVNERAAPQLGLGSPHVLRAKGNLVGFHPNHDSISLSLSLAELEDMAMGIG